MVLRDAPLRGFFDFNTSCFPTRNVLSLQQEEAAARWFPPFGLKPAEFRPKLSLFQKKLSLVPLSRPPLPMLRATVPAVEMRFPAFGEWFSAQADVKYVNVECMMQLYKINKIISFRKISFFF